MLVSPVQVWVSALERPAASVGAVVGGSSNGRTTDFGSVNRGSNPCPPAIAGTGHPVPVGLSIGVRQPISVAPVAQWQSTGLWFQMLRVRIPSGAPSVIQQRLSHSVACRHSARPSLYSRDLGDAQVLFGHVSRSQSRAPSCWYQRWAHFDA